jgi:hypothetical protein
MNLYYILDLIYSSSLGIINRSLKSIKPSRF